MASSEIPMQVAETIQTAHINRAPSAQHDLNPSTAADTREPVHLDKDEAHVVDDDDDDIPVSVLRPARRFSNLPPIPDLRFEQSYLHSIQDAKSWWMVAWITTKDQLVMPMLQGVVYNLAWCGWQYWNRNAQMSGNSIGAQVRRWWWGVNNWPIPSRPVAREKRDWFRR
ncbi:hypothetical protein SLS64_002844 [Diaporthe eres]|uniref:DUF1770-domain-containing protein n=1 Tax=Diaporthe eres TaxID=83184 RepID=A0ABR1PLI1_DIAER